MIHQDFDQAGCSGCRACISQRAFSLSIKKITQFKAFYQVPKKEKSKESFMGASRPPVTEEGYGSLGLFPFIRRLSPLI